MRIQQVWLPETDRIDRCATCHAGMVEPPSIQSRLKDAPEPFRPHPRLLAHDVSEFGCTYCHGGQGPATTKDKAHGDDPHWHEPLLPARYTEAGCGACHLGSDVNGAPILSEGRRLMDEAKCLSCHTVEGVAESVRSAPDLDGLGSKVTSAWLRRWLRSPADVLLNAVMPDFGLGEEEIDRLEAYLLSQTSELDPIPALEPDPDRGGVRYRESRCISCHAVDGTGGTLAPDLGAVAEKANRRWLYNYIKDPHRFQPDTLMPQYGLTEHRSIGFSYPRGQGGALVIGAHRCKVA